MSYRANLNFGYKTILQECELCTRPIPDQRDQFYQTPLKNTVYVSSVGSTPEAILSLN